MSAHPSSTSSAPDRTLKRLRVPRGGVVAGALVFVLYAGSAFLVRATYESEAALTITRASPEGEARAAGPATPGEHLKEQLQAMLDASGVVEQPPPGAADDPRRGTELRLTSPTAASLWCRSGTAQGAQAACDRAAKAVVDRYNADQKRQVATADGSLLEKRTAALVAFLAEHPDVAVDRTTPAAPSPAPSADAPSPPSTDSAIVLLRQERALIEAKLREEADGQGSDGGHPKEWDFNPYDDPKQPVDTRALRRRLTEIRNVIAAREAAIAHARDPAAREADKSPAAPELKAEWQRLVQAVVDAKSAPPPAAPVPGWEARVVRPALLPDRPIHPNRPLLILLGALSGVGVAVLWAVARALATRTRVQPAGARPAAPRSDPPPPEASPQPMRRPNSEMIPPPRALLPPAGAAPARSDEAPARRHRHRLTQRGVIDVASVLAQTGTAPESALGAIAAKPIVEVGPEGQVSTSSHAPPAPISSNPPAPTRVAGHAVVVPKSPLPPRMSTPPPAAAYPSPMPPRPKSPPPPRWASSSPLSKTIVGQPRPLDEEMNPPSTRRLGSRSPARPSSDPPPMASEPRVETATSYSFVDRDRNAPASVVEGVTATERVESKRPSLTPADNVVAPRSVPPSWVLDPELDGADPSEKLRSLREQLLRHALDGCFVVGVSSAQNAEADKTTVASRLAVMLAKPGNARVLLMEANFNSPGVHRVMRVDVPVTCGFSEQIRQRMGSSAREPWGVVECMPSLHVLAEGLMRTPGVLVSVQFAEAISDLRRYYDLIVADGPVADAGVDTRAFDGVTDGIIIATRENAPSLDDAVKWYGEKRLTGVVVTAPDPGKGRPDKGKKRGK